MAAVLDNLFERSALHLGIRGGVFKPAELQYRRRNILERHKPVQTGFAWDNARMFEMSGTQMLVSYIP